MTLEFDEARHQYRLDGEKCPSVTQVLGVLGKPGLDYWAYGLAINGVLDLLQRYSVDPSSPNMAEKLKKALHLARFSPNAVVQDAADKGRKVHTAFSDFAATGELVGEESVKGYVSSLQKFIDAFAPKIVSVEQHVYSPSLRVAGTFDALLEIDGQLVLVDWKTSKRVYDSHHVQVAAYEGMRAELGESPATAMVVRLDSAGAVPEFVQSRATYEEFEAAFVLYKARKRIEKAYKGEQLIAA